MYVLSWPVMPDSLPPQGLKPARLLGPWDFPGKNTGVGWHFLLQGILPAQRSNPTIPGSPALAGGFFTSVPPMAYDLSYEQQES